MAEIVPVVSEALEAQVRDLLPSQRGFGEDLQASNVITPIIDLTAAAQGTTTPELLQTALAFGSQTAFSIQNATTTLINTTGFYRVIGTSNVPGVTPPRVTTFIMSDGLSNKNVWTHRNDGLASIAFDFVVFLVAGETLSGNSSGTNAYLVGSTRQIADINGNLVNPVGFTPQ